MSLVPQWVTDWLSRRVSGETLRAQARAICPSPSPVLLRVLEKNLADGADVEKLKSAHARWCNAIPRCGNQPGQLCSAVDFPQIHKPDKFRPIGPTVRIAHMEACLGEEEAKRIGQYLKDPRKTALQRCMEKSPSTQPMTEEPTMPRTYPYIPSHADDLELGCTVTDRITGVSGVATAKCEYLTGCTQYCVTGKAKEDGKYPDTHWLDWQRLEVTLPNELADINTGRKDGCMDTPPGGAVRGR